MTTLTDISRKTTKGVAFLIEDSTPHDIFTPEDLSDEHLAVGRMVGHMADLAERLDEVFGGIAVVFDDQQTHCVHRNAPAEVDRSGPFTVAKIYLAILQPARPPDPLPNLRKGDG